MEFSNIDDIGTERPQVDPHIRWYLGNIDPYIDQIKQLFEENANHKHADNYLVRPLFDETVFARLGFCVETNQLVYYSAGLARMQYMGGIRIMSRHTRKREFDWGDLKTNFRRGVETLDESTKHSLELGYKDVFFSREEGHMFVKHLQRYSQYLWNVAHEEMHYGGKQWVLRLK